MAHFDLKVGFYCCQDCVHCVVTDSRKYGNLSFDQIKNTISNIPQSDSITLTGGEPTLRPDFMKIVHLCKNHKEISLQTNGIGLTEEICKKLQEYNIKVLLTIHSCNKEIYLKISRGPKEGYDKAIQAAKNLTEYRIPFTWQIVVHKLNKDTVIETFRLAKSINPSIPLKFTNPHPMGNAYNKKLLCTLTELKPLIKKVCSEFENDIWFEMVPFCYLSGYEKIINRSQTKTEESLGLRFENNLNVKPYNMKYLRIKNKNCKNCCYFNRNCPGIYVEYKSLFGDREIHPKLITFKNKTTDCFYDKHYMYENFSLWLFLTTKCNCNCTYCKQSNNEPESQYQKFLSENINKSMTKENLTFIFDTCVESNTRGLVKKFFINLSGGEPFLAFDIFSDVVSQYKKNYPELFEFSTSTNGTLINNKIVNWAAKNLSSCLFSLDSLQFSKPINNISSSKLQIENIKKINNAGFKPLILSVYHNQTVEEMIEMAEFAIKYSSHWRILLSNPYSHTKDEILKFAKPVIKYLFQNNFYSPKLFDFDSWDLWGQKQITGCPCGKTFFSILPNLDVSPTNGENTITLGKFTWDFPSFINNQNNSYYKNGCRPSVCNDCTLKHCCDGSCKVNHKFPEFMKERCDSIKELINYVKTFKELSLFSKNIVN